MLINHEVGHRLGRDHVRLRPAGRPRARDDAADENPDHGRRHLPPQPLAVPTNADRPGAGGSSPRTAARAGTDHQGRRPLPPAAERPSTGCTTLPAEPSRRSPEAVQGARSAGRGPPGSLRTVPCPSHSALKRASKRKVTSVHPFRWCDGQPSITPPGCALTVFRHATEPVRQWSDMGDDGGARAHGTADGGWLSVRAGESVAWCDRLLRGLGGHEFEIYALSTERPPGDAAAGCELPPHVLHVRIAPLWGEPQEHRASR